MAPWSNRTAAAINPEFTGANRGSLGTDPNTFVFSLNVQFVEKNRRGTASIKAQVGS